ncbi:HAMP domain-containing protein [Sorangium sp. So ce1014]|uniref:HAMP domain-containing protein n=1 Tax=Sorangium sp. So ce1014 TaxID=3133326 RepID=UPI003F604519
MQKSIASLLEFVSPPPLRQHRLVISCHPAPFRPSWRPPRGRPEAPARACSTPSRPRARAVAHPIERLRAVARALGAGRIEARSAIARQDEIGDLARSFDEMADRLVALHRAEKELPPPLLPRRQEPHPRDRRHGARPGAGEEDRRRPRGPDQVVSAPNEGTRARVLRMTYVVRRARAPRPR